jgi:hypothetical protein
VQHNSGLWRVAHSATVRWRGEPEAGRRDCVAAVASWLEVKKQDEQSTRRAELFVASVSNSVGGGGG